MDVMVDWTIAVLDSEIPYEKTPIIVVEDIERAPEVRNPLPITECMDDLEVRLDY